LNINDSHSYLHKETDSPCALRKWFALGAWSSQGAGSFVSVACDAALIRRPHFRNGGHQAVLKRLGRSVELSRAEQMIRCFERVTYVGESAGSCLSKFIARLTCPLHP